MLKDAYRYTVTKKHFRKVQAMSIIVEKFNPLSRVHER